MTLDKDIHTLADPSGGGGPSVLILRQFHL